MMMKSIFWWRYQPQHSNQEKTGYQRLSEIDDETQQQFRVQTPRFSKRRLATIGIVLLAVSVIGAGLLLGFAPRQKDCNCGNSIKEALTKGCKYDPMATSWLPPICRDDELIEEFNHAGPGPDGAWAYYKDQNGTQTMTLEEVGQLAEKTGDEAAFWTTHEWHLAHCLFYWKKESRARKSGKVVIEKSFEGEYHVKHCSQMWPRVTDNMEFKYKECPEDDRTLSSESLLHDAEVGNQKRPLPKRQPWIKFIHRFKTILYIALALYGLLSLLLQTIKYIQSQQPITCDCGRSTAEALSKGCKYDTMSAAWLPEPCRDDELSAEFDRMGPGPNGKWSYWADQNRTRELSIEELSLLPDNNLPFFTTWDWHVAHCSYRWRKQLRPNFLFYKMNRDAAYGHVEHCEEVMRVHDREQTIMSGVGLNGSTYS
ncbi:hypothetical protein ETB97_011435 [Aspergillus alliaceus]|uniref:Uncharacterized protein n=1 Tax=Petromyces alliaceus TaxID=209559 RepID=A0A8H6ECS4_PETAA|nr:hypothetical protein ETB97_011435 [Aspergillus burnettii]